MRAEGAAQEEITFLRKLGIAASVVISLLVAWWVVHALFLLFAGGLLAVFLGGIRAFLQRRLHLGQKSAFALTVVLCLMVFAGGGWWIGADVAQQSGELGEQLPKAWTKIKTDLEQHPWGEKMLAYTFQLDGMTNSEGMLKRAAGVFSSTFGAIVSFMIIVATGLFLAAQPGYYKEGLIKLFPKPRRHRAAEVAVDVKSTLGWWLVGRLISMFAVGALTTIALWLLGIPSAITLGLIAGLLTFIPFIGPILSAVPAMLLALMEGPWMVLYVALAYVGVQILEGNLITPLVQQRAVSLPPVLTIIAQVILGLLIGALGVILATPFTAAFMVLVQRLYIEDALNDKPQASP